MASTLRAILRTLTELLLENCRGYAAIPKWSALPDNPHLSSILVLPRIWSRAFSHLLQVAGKGWGRISLP